MPILQLPPNPARFTPDSESPQDPGTPASQPVKVRTGRYGELEEHELIHLLDALDDERSRARFRESVYISFIIYLAIIWFLFYGPRVLFHQPEYKDPIAAMKEHDKQLTMLEAPHTVAPRPPAHPMPDRKTLQQLQQQPRTTPVAPTESQPPPQPQQAANTPTPPVTQPALPLPPAPHPSSSLPDAPPAHPSIAQNSSSPHDAMQNLLRGRPGTGGTEYNSGPSAAGPLQAGATILSDTMGVDFSEYMRKLHHDIQRNWDPLIPEEVEPPLLKKGITGIRFTILPDGKVGGMTLEFKSGDVALDKAAWYAITSEGTFPPLPKEFHGPQLELRVGFYYNTPVQQ